MSHEALYGVLSKSMGARLRFFGMAMTVKSLTPSRMGIITSRFAKS